jgi:hypothetical protein
MGTPRTADSVATGFAERVRELLPDSMVLLFGSRARGDRLAESDYDFIVVSDAFAAESFPERSGRLYPCFPWEEHGAEILCYTKEEFDRKRRQICIVREAVREGIRL